MQNLLSVGVTKDSMQQMILEWDIRRRTCCCRHRIVVDKYVFSNGHWEGKLVGTAKRNNTKEKY